MHCMLKIDECWKIRGKCGYPMLPLKFRNHCAWLRIEIIVQIKLNFLENIVASLASENWSCVNVNTFMKCVHRESYVKFLYQSQSQSKNLTLKWFNLKCEFTNNPVKFVTQTRIHCTRLMIWYALAKKQDWILKAQTQDIKGT